MESVLVAVTAGRQELTISISSYHSLISAYCSKIEDLLVPHKKRQSQIFTDFRFPVSAVKFKPSKMVFLYRAARISITYSITELTCVSGVNPGEPTEQPEHPKA